MDALVKLGINVGFLLLQIFAFALLLAILGAWVYKPLLQMIEERRKKLAQAMEDARVAAEARANAEQEAQKILAEARAKADEIIREARERAEEQRRALLEQAQAEAEKLKREALAEVEEERNRVLAELREQIAALAVAAAQKIVGASLDEQRQHELLEEFFAGVKGKQVVVLDELEATTADQVEVISAVPLTNEEKALITEQLKAKVGDAPIVFKVDPSILGGLVIRVGDQIVDASVARQMALLRQKLA